MVFFYNICICYYLSEEVEFYKKEKMSGGSTCRVRGADMKKIIYYLFEAEDTCSQCQPEEECFSYAELSQVLKLLKTLVWVCIAVVLGLAIGNL